MESACVELEPEFVSSSFPPDLASLTNGTKPESAKEQHL